MSDFIPSEPLKTPVLMLVFNRPEQTREVFEMVRKAKPPRLYIGADGSRPGKDEERVAAVRAIFEDVDWDCEVKTLYQDVNLGCSKAPPAAISWFFENEESGIILEDDCLPSMSFFWFCQDLLEYYKDDTRIMQISGSNFQDGWVRDSDYSYYFSEESKMWGWASWRRAWDHYDRNVALFEELKKKGYLDEWLWNQPSTSYIMNFLKTAHQKGEDINVWGYQWFFTTYIQSGLSVIPNVNLVQNIGINQEDATHTTNLDVRHEERAFFEAEFPLKHPRFVMKDKVSDKRYYDRYYLNSLSNKVQRNLRKIVAMFSLW